MNACERRDGARNSDGSKYDPKSEKTRRVQLIMQPSLKAAAEKKGVSVNEYIHTVLEKLVRKK